ncbi:hypothetical protein [Salinimicrobium sp. TH3]|uniref:hypothetical protein n=1 Tax=Salinimicrobium sp. TH3 TaxID=2997342 RepID=UPI002272D9AE|nr:hypothetical protein [Salinimicrobium sp. TH3]MCY2686497.1 hypothetical protein [Salinimicrobium sp. TH3]
MRSDPLIETSFFPAMEEFVLWVAIAVFTTAVIFFITTLVKSIKRLEEERRKKKYQALIENILFKYLFEEQSLEEVLKYPDFVEVKEQSLFQRVAIKALIALHDNYSGNYSKRLEHFFDASGLVNYSIAKLESNSWPHIVEGVRDLSTLNHGASYSRIASHIIHPHELVKTEVLLALIKMGGIEEIMKFKKSELQLNDWIQSNILYTVKKHRIPAPANLDVMLESKNTTIVLLAVRLINYYKKAEYYDALSLFYQETKNKKLKREIAQVLKNTEFVI